MKNHFIVQIYFYNLNLLFKDDLSSIKESLLFIITKADKNIIASGIGNSIIPELDGLIEDENENLNNLLGNKINQIILWLN